MKLFATLLCVVILSACSFSGPNRKEKEEAITWHLKYHQPSDRVRVDFSTPRNNFFSPKQSGSIDTYEILNSYSRKINGETYHFYRFKVDLGTFGYMGDGIVAMVKRGHEWQYSDKMQ